MFHVKHSDCRFQLWIADAFTRYTVQRQLFVFVGINSKPFYKKMFHVKHTCDIIDADKRISVKCIIV